MQRPNSLQKSPSVSKKIAILQSCYIPWKGYFDLINSVDEFVIYDDAQYTRRDWRNRNQIKTKDGLLWLTVPVEVKGKFEQKINETKIADSKWADKHFASLLHHYKKAPAFGLYKDILSDLYETASGMQSLSQVNYLFLKRICELLGIKTPLRWSHEFELADGKSAKLLSICQQLNANTYISGPAAKAYLDTDLFTAKNIDVTWYDYSGYPEYPQLYPPFVHTVSIIDLLLNCGTDSTKYMKTFTR